MQAQLGPEWPDFLAALSAPAPVSVRLHVLKNKKWQDNFNGVKWCSNGVYLPERPVFTLDPAFHAGAYYVQEASSMLTGAAVRQLFPSNTGLRVLDLAAAPGGKSTLLAEWLAPDSLLVANEVIRSRFQTLQYNLIKWGYPNYLVSNHDSRDFAPLEGWFDLVLLDAPCSGEGLFRKDPGAMEEWSPANVQLCSARQRRILAEAAALVRTGGILLYSTCTYNQEENARNAAWLMEQYGFQHVALDWPPDWGIQTAEAGYQCYPHRVQGEGFYLAALRKTACTAAKSLAKNPKFPGWEAVPAQLAQLAGQWLDIPGNYRLFSDKHGHIRAIPKAVETRAAEAANVLRRNDWGLELGQLKGKDFIPSPSLALSNAIRPDLPGVELDKTTALRFLKKESIELPGASAGWLLMRYQGLNLGWAKVLPNRVNNYYPREWRILMAIEG